MNSPWIHLDRPALVLAPMEGVTDAPMRAYLTERPGLSFCVSEFLRITHLVPPDRVYFRHVPELHHNARTPTGTPVQIQLLGGNAEKMAESAVRACLLGAQAVDINFGCPAPLVNRHDGGAALLKAPARIQQIVRAVRANVPKEIPVSAKLRLGWENPDDIFENAQRAEAGGASWITVHARTKIQGYAPPVFWKRIGEVRRRLGIPVVANGDIWTAEDFLRCRDITECRHYMIGRGAMADPYLPQFIARELGLLSCSGSVETFGADALLWREALQRFSILNKPFAKTENNTAKRFKQWVRMSTMKQPIPWFDLIKRLDSPSEIEAALGEWNRPAVI